VKKKVYQREPVKKKVYQREPNDLWVVPLKA